MPAFVDTLEHPGRQQAETTYARLTRLADAKIDAPWSVQAWQGVLAGGTLCLGTMNANLVEAAVSGAHECHIGTPHSVRAVYRHSLQTSVLTAPLRCPTTQRARCPGCPTCWAAQSSPLA